MRQKTRDWHDTAIAREMEEQRFTFAAIANSGRQCSGITLQVGEYWYSVACFYGKKLNVATTGPLRDG